MLNMSIDAPNVRPGNANGNDDFNYIDCYIEYVAEVVLKYENAIPESKSRHQKDLQRHMQLQVYQISKSTAFAKPAVYESTGPFFNFPDTNIYQYIAEINPPPPKLI